MDFHISAVLSYMEKGKVITDIQKLNFRRDIKTKTVAAFHPTTLPPPHS